MCKRRCKYKSDGGICVYAVSTHQSRVAAVYKQLGVKRLTAEAKELLDGDNCSFFESGAYRGAPRDQILLDGSTPRPKAKPRPRSFDVTEARALYDQGRSDREIGAAVGVSAGAIQAWRRVEGLTANRFRGFDEERARELYEQGRNDREIGVNLGVSRSAIFDWRKRNGLLANWGWRSRNGLPANYWRIGQ